MCGIAGLFIKDPKLEGQLGALLTKMTATLCSRGPDSAGFAIYGAGQDGKTKLTIAGPTSAYDIGAAAEKLRAAIAPKAPVRLSAITSRRRLGSNTASPSAVSIAPSR